MNIKNKITFWILELSGPNVRNKMNALSVAPCSSGFYLVIGIFRKDIKQVVTEKCEFDNKVESIVTALFGVFGLFGFWMTIVGNWYFISKVL